jgi:hypothetical protein
MLTSRQVLTMLAEEGISIHRETLARVSDHLELRTRPPEARGVRRIWTAEQVRVLIDHFRRVGWTPTRQTPRRAVTASSGPFHTRDVLAFLEAQGITMHRETLARISDQLGLRTRAEEAPTVQRQWSRHQVDELLDFIHRREQQKRLTAALETLSVQSVRDLLEADPSLLEQLQPLVDAFFAARRALTGSSPSTASAQTSEEEEAA